MLVQALHTNALYSISNFVLSNIEQLSHSISKFKHLKTVMASHTYLENLLGCVGMPDPTPPPPLSALLLML
jgi:hypothetical protein